MSTTLVTKDYQDFIDTGSDITPILNRLFEAFVDIRSSGRYSIDLKAAPQDSTAWEYVIYNSASEPERSLGVLFARAHQGSGIRSGRNSTKSFPSLLLPQMTL
jgi:hypothetical protein